MQEYNIKYNIIAYTYSLKIALVTVYEKSKKNHWTRLKFSLILVCENKQSWFVFNFFHCD